SPLLFPPLLRPPCSSTPSSSLTGIFAERRSSRCASFAVVPCSFLRSLYIDNPARVVGFIPLAERLPSLLPATIRRSRPAGHCYESLTTLVDPFLHLAYMAPTDFLRRRTPGHFVKGHSILSRTIEMPPLDTIAKPWRPIVLPGDKLVAVPSFAEITRRGSDKPGGSDDSSDRLVNLMLIILGLVFFALILASLLFLLRRRRRLMRQRTQELPTHKETEQTSNHRGLTIETSHHGRSSILYIGRDGQPMLQNPNSPPHSPDNVPEIHITFPDEQDDQGRTKSGRVLVVRVGDNATIGLEPVHDEQLPAYEKEAKGQFQSIDMDQIGGLKEKDRNLFQ
ncbi:Uncharacterized protein TCAP_00266, partial [Tolypocladium capitatum]